MTESARKTGRPELPPEDRMVVWTLRVPASLRDKLRDAPADEVRAALARWISRRSGLHRTPE